MTQLTPNIKAFIMIAITGVSGLLGRQVVEDLLQNVAAKDIVAIVRTPSKVRDLS